MRWRDTQGRTGHREPEQAWADFQDEKVNKGIELGRDRSNEGRVTFLPALRPKAHQKP